MIRVALWCANTKQVLIGDRRPGRTFMTEGNMTGCRRKSARKGFVLLSNGWSVYKLCHRWRRISPWEGSPERGPIVSAGSTSARWVPARAYFKHVLIIVNAHAIRGCAPFQMLYSNWTQDLFVRQSTVNPSGIWWLICTWVACSLLNYWISTDFLSIWNASTPVKTPVRARFHARFSLCAFTLH